MSDDKFCTGDRVTIVNPHSVMCGLSGVVDCVNGEVVIITLEDGIHGLAFSEDELEVGESPYV